MAAMTRLRVLGLGDNTVDTYVDRHLQFPGGNAVNVAVLCRRLGAQASYLGCLGSDEAGDVLRAALAAEGVEQAAEGLAERRQPLQRQEVQQPDQAEAEPGHHGGGSVPRGAL